MAMADTSKVPTPTLDALGRERDQVAVLSCFFDFMSENHYLAQGRPGSPQTGLPAERGVCPASGQVISEYLEINPDHVEVEKQALLDTISLPDGEFVVPEHAKP